MDAVEFLKTKNRICRTETCENCPLGDRLSCNECKNNEVEKIVAKVEQWGKDHPVKTRQSEFLKMFPNANTNKDKDGTLHACPAIFEPEIEIKCDGDCAICKFKRDYWLQEVE